MSYVDDYGALHEPTVEVGVRVHIVLSAAWCLHALRVAIFFSFPLYGLTLGEWTHERALYFVWNQVVEFSHNIGSLEGTFGSWPSFLWFPHMSLMMKCIWFFMWLLRHEVWMLMYKVMRMVWARPLLRLCKAIVVFYAAQPSQTVGIHIEFILTWITLLKS